MKRLLLSAVVLSSMGAYAQVGINTTEPEAMLDVNGDLRVQSVEKATMGAGTTDLFPDCTPCVMLIDTKGVVKRIPRSEFFEGNTSGSTQPTTSYQATKQFTASDDFTKEDCPSGKTPEPYTVRMTAEVTVYSTVSEEKAAEEALAKATEIANTWVLENGQAEANEYGICRPHQPMIFTATAGPKSEKRTMQRNNCLSGEEAISIEITSPEFRGEGRSYDSLDEAQNIANADLERKINEWFADEGQIEANSKGVCDKFIDGRSTKRVCDKNGHEVGQVFDHQIWSFGEPYGGSPQSRYLYIYEKANMTCTESIVGRMARASYGRVAICTNSSSYGYIWFPAGEGNTPELEMCKK